MSGDSSLTPGYQRGRRPRGLAQGVDRVLEALGPAVQFTGIFRGLGLRLAAQGQRQGQAEQQGTQPHGAGSVGHPAGRDQGQCRSWSRSLGAGGSLICGDGRPGVGAQPTPQVGLLPPSPARSGLRLSGAIRSRAPRPRETWGLLSRRRPRGPEQSRPLSSLGRPSSRTLPVWAGPALPPRAAGPGQASVFLSVMWAQ